MTCSLFGQSSDLTFDTYSIENGLSQNSVYSICQTKEGLLWIATNDGINRFDGKEFRVFRPTTSDNVSRSAVILSLIAIDNHHLLVATGNELLIFDTNIQVFYPVDKFYPFFDFPPKIQIIKVYKSSDERLWILTQTQGVFCYDTKIKKTFHFFANGPFSDKLTDITIDKNGHIFVSSETAVFILLNDSFTPIIFPQAFNKKYLNIREIAFIDDKLWVASHKTGVSVFHLDSASFNASFIKTKYNFQHDITEILVCHSSEVWIGSRSNGLIKYDSFSKSYQSALAGNNPGQLAKNFILTMFEDLNGNVWVGLSGGGIQKYKRPRPLFNFIKSKNNDVNHDPMTFCISSSDDNIFYMGTLIGGLAEYNKSLNSFHFYTDKRLPTESINIYGIVSDGDILWLATWAGLCSFNKKTKSFIFFADHIFGKGEQLYSILKIPSHNLLLLSGEKGIVYFDIQRKIFLNKPDGLADLPIPLITARHMVLVNDHEIWMATVTHNFVKYNFITGQYDVNKDFNRISSSSRYFSVKGDTLWLATDDGLIQSNLKNFNIDKLWNKEDGLADNFIYSVLVDKQNFIWVATNRGLSRINIYTKRVNNYTKKDGLQDLEFNSAACMKTQSGNLWFGGINGVNEVELDKISNIDFTCQPIVTGIHVLNEFYELDTSSVFKKKIALSYHQNFISFDFIAPNAMYQDELDYKYRLTGVDNNWIAAKGRTYASYTQLRPGTYTFEVVSIDKSGNESIANEILVVSISKPFWLTYWFISICILLLSCTVYLFVNFRLTQLKQKHTINQRMAELEMNALQSQMNPHFIFNSLNSISEMIMLKDNSNASKYLTKFARLIRTTLDHSTQDWISLDATINYINQYLEMEKLRMERLECHVTVDEALSKLMIKLPPHILQPIIENAIWHGVATNKDQRIIYIRYYSDSHHFYIEVEDNGIGYNTSILKNELRLKKGSLINIRKRLDLIKEKYNFEIKLDIMDKNDLFASAPGTLVRLTFPQFFIE